NTLPPPLHEMQTIRSGARGNRQTAWVPSAGALLLPGSEILTDHFPSSPAAQGVVNDLIDVLVDPADRAVAHGDENATLVIAVEASDPPGPRPTVRAARRPEGGPVKVLPRPHARFEEIRRQGSAGDRHALVPGGLGAGSIGSLVAEHDRVR